MAVYERTYKRYTGPMTTLASRWTIVPRYAFRDVFKSKLFVAFFALCFVFPIICTVLVYFRHNADILLALDVPIEEFLEIDADFFEIFLMVQGWGAFLLTLFVGPGLVSRDLLNNAMPLYLSRPFNDRDYVLGKLSVLAALLSLVTWIPGLILFMIQGNLAKSGWLWANLRIAGGIFVGSWIWILTLALLSLALSAWVRWKIVSAFLLLMIVFTGSFFAFMVNRLFGGHWGDILNLSRIMRIVWASLLGTPPPAGPSIWAACTVLLALACFCLFLLHRKVRAYEVIK